LFILGIIICNPGRDKRDRVNRRLARESETITIQACPVPGSFDGIHQRAEILLCQDRRSMYSSVLT
jgi:hypothetical protein